MSDEKKPNEETALVETRRVLRPSMTLPEVMAAKKERDEYIQKTLVDGRDYGVIPGTRKPTLLKPGAEAVNSWYNVMATFETVDKTVTLDPPLYRYVRRCALIHRDSGTLVGEGTGSCSTTEKKFRGREGDVENNVIKMADKRALVAATLFTYGLSDRFTQDTEDGNVVDVDGLPDIPPPPMEEPAARMSYSKYRGGDADAPDTFWKFENAKKKGSFRMGAVAGSKLTVPLLEGFGFTEWGGKYYRDYDQGIVNKLTELGGHGR